MLVDREMYGRELRREYLDRTGANLPYGSLYTTLERMFQKGFLLKRLGESPPERGGNRRTDLLEDPRELRQRRVQQGVGGNLRCEGSPKFGGSVPLLPANPSAL